MSQTDTTNTLSLVETAEHLDFSISRTRALVEAGHLVGHWDPEAGQWFITLTSVRAFEGGRRRD